MGRASASVGALFRVQGIVGDLMRNFTLLTWAALWSGISILTLAITGCHWGVLIHAAHKTGMH